MDSKPEELKAKKPKLKMSKDILNIIRTTMRNNMDLTQIADNKANVLLSLNAFMITFLIPFAIPYFDVIKYYRLEIPLVILIITCMITIYLSTLVLKPGKFFINKERREKGQHVSPFFFGNFYEMSREEFGKYIEAEVSKKEFVRQHVIDDMHYFGARLGRKMTIIRRAFTIFLTGLFLSIGLSLILLLVNGGAFQ